MATLPKLDSAPLQPSPTASMRGISLDSSSVPSAMLAASRDRGAGAKYIAAGLNDVGDALDAVQLADDKRAAKDQLTQYSAGLRTLLYGDGTPDNPGYYSLKGDDAVNARGKVQASIEKLRQDYLSKSVNRRSGMLFNDTSLALTAPELDNIAVHSQREKVVAEKASSLAALGEAVSRFSANPNDEKIRQQSALIVEQEALAQADAAGIRDGDARQAMVRSALSEMYKEGISTELQRDVGAGQAMYLKYRSLIDGQDQSKIENDIHVAQRAKQAEEEHRALMGRMAQEQADKAAFNHYISEAIKPGGSIDLAAVSADKNMDGSSKLTLFNVATVMDRSENTPSKISKATTSNLYARMLLPDGNPGKITDESQIVQAFVDGNLSRTDFDWTLKAFQEMRTADGQKLTTQLGKFLDSVKPSIVAYSPMGIPGAHGSEYFYGFQQYVHDRLIEARKNNEDPYELLRPGSKDFLGRPEIVSQFQPTAQEVAADRANELAGKTTPLSKVPPIYKSVDDVVSAYHDGRITWDAAAKWLDAHGYKRHTNQ